MSRLPRTYAQSGRPSLSTGTSSENLAGTIKGTARWTPEGRRVRQGEWSKSKDTRYKSGQTGVSLL